MKRLTKRGWWGFILATMGLISFFSTWFQLAESYSTADLKFIIISGNWLIVSVLAFIYGDYVLNKEEKRSKKQLED